MATWGRNDAIQSGAGGKATSRRVRVIAPNAPDRNDGRKPLNSLPIRRLLPLIPSPLPTVYGVYAINGNQLIQAEQTQGTPVDPRTRNQLQIGKPSRTVINPTKPKFVVYHRDLASSAPDNVQVRIAARIAHSMIFDSKGKPIVTAPATATWLIRDIRATIYGCRRYGKAPRWFCCARRPRNFRFPQAAMS